MLVDSFFTFEKLRYTEKCFFEFYKKEYRNDWINVFKDQMTSVSLHCGDDTINNFLKRVNDNIKFCPSLHKIWHKYMKCASEHDSIFSSLDRYYDYILFEYKRMEKP